MRKYQYYDTGDDGDYDGYTANWLAQTFTPQATHMISKVKLKLFRVGDPGTITVSIKATTSGKPSGADLCKGTIEGLDLTLDTNGEWYEITLGDGYTVSKGAQYAIVVRAPSGDSSNKVSWRADKTSPTYTGGTYCSSSDSGVDWGIISGADCMFEEWGTGEPSPTTVTWGNLLKSQISAEKIEEAILRMIQDHEDDPNAHLETGESLYSHKASEIIDHIVASIIADKIKDNEVIDPKLHSISSWKRLVDIRPEKALLLKKKVWTGEAGDLSAVDVVTDHEHFYVGIFTAPAKVMKIDPSTMATVATWTGASGEDYCSSITFDGTYIYVGLQRGFAEPCRIVKINPSTMATVATWTGAAGENNIARLTFDGTYIYAGIAESPAKVIKINTSTMATVATWTGAAGENDCSDLAFDGIYIYAGLNIIPGQVKKINPSTMATVATWTGAAGKELCEGLTFDGTYIYAGLYLFPVEIVKINPSTMATISIWTGAAGENYCNNLTFDGTYICAALATSPAKVIRKIMRDVDETGT